MNKSWRGQQNLQAFRAAQAVVQKVARRCVNDYWVGPSRQHSVSRRHWKHQSHVCRNQEGSWPDTEEISNAQVFHWRDYKRSSRTDGPLGRKLLRTLLHREHFHRRGPKCLWASTNDARARRRTNYWQSRKALNCLSSGKAPGKDGIRPEIVRLCRGSLLTDLHAIFCLCWREDQVLQDMRDSNIATLYRNKGVRSECNSYRGISLLGIVVK